MLSLSGRSCHRNGKMTIKELSLNNCHISRGHPPPKKTEELLLLREAVFYQINPCLNTAIRAKHDYLRGCQLLSFGCKECGNTDPPIKCKMQSDKKTEHQNV